MKCPVCEDAVLVITDRQGVEIDYCPNCRGVWLDRGELDKIIERSSQITASGASHRDEQSRDKDRSRRDSVPKKKKKRESFLSELFDFDF